MIVKSNYTLEHMPTASMQRHDHRIRTLALKVGRFILHLLEMLLAMVAGMFVLSWLLDLIPLYSSLYFAFRSGTNLYDLAMVIFMTVPMVAWMIVRGHGKRHGAEMAFAMFAPVAAVILLRLAGAGSSLPWLAYSGHMGPFLGMLIAMMVRHDHYTAKAGHSKKAVH